MLDPKDGGYKSRKMWMAYAVMGLVTVGFFATGKWPALGVTFAEYCMAVLGATTIYVGGNSMTKWLTARNMKAGAVAPPAEESSAETEESAPSDVSKK